MAKRKSSGSGAYSMTAIRDRYRCPEGITQFRVRGELSPKSRFFHFGSDAVCYGQLSLSSKVDVSPSTLPDLSGDVTTEGSTVILPFDPSQIIDNLRLEHYALSAYAGKEILSSNAAIRKIYYSLRPFLDISVRSHLQRLCLRNWKDLCFPSWPVDRTVENVLEGLLSLSMKAHNSERIPFIWFWPEGAPSCVVMTHDVEAKEGVEFVSQLMDIDDQFGIKASFQVVPQERYSVPKDLLDEIRSRGFELNVQDLKHDGHLFDDRDAFFEQARAINRYVHDFGAQGFRAGCMYRNAAWYEALDISYDMSIPNVAHLEPQRGGCCTVFPYFIGGILELPLTTTQDYSLFHILRNYSTDLWKKQTSQIAEKHGCVSFIAHPDYIRENRALEVYKELLEHLAELRDQGFWMPLPRDVNRWWRQRNEMKLVRHGDTWQVEGPGKERARLAYASLDGDRVVYTIEGPGSEGSWRRGSPAVPEAALASGRSGIGGSSK
jgi:hypothetical protein